MRLHRLLCWLGGHCPEKAGNGGLYCRCCRKLVGVTPSERAGLLPSVEPLGPEYWGWPL